MIHFLFLKRTKWVYNHDENYYYDLPNTPLPKTLPKTLILLKRLHCLLLQAHYRFDPVAIFGINEYNWILRRQLRDSDPYGLPPSKIYLLKWKSTLAATWNHRHIPFISHRTPLSFSLCLPLCPIPPSPSSPTWSLMLCIVRFCCLLTSAMVAPLSAVSWSQHAVDLSHPYSLHCTTN